MTLTSALLSFAVVVGLMTLTPGLDTAMVLRSALSQGRRAGIFTALGISLGIMAWAIAAAVGISALLTASEVAYTALKWAGTVYMLWLGFGMLKSALMSQPHLADEVLPTTKESISAWSALQRGLLTNLLNPKVGVFYIALLPQFMPVGTSQVVAGAALGLVHAGECLVWLTFLASLAHQARQWMRQPKIQRSVDGVAGLAVIGFGLKLGLARH